MNENGVAAEKKLSAKTRAQVFLSYYKWYIAIALFFVVFITIMCLQMFTKEDYDISVMYAGNAVLGDNESADMEKALQKLGTEKEKAVLYELVIMNDEQLAAAYEKGYTNISVNPEKIRKNREMFAFNIMSDEYFILLLSPECYDIVASNGAIEKLDDLGVNNNAEARFSEYALKLRSLEYAKVYSAFSVLPEDTLLCFKKISEMNENDKGKKEKRAHDAAIFTKIANYSLFTAQSALGTNAQLWAPNLFREELL